MVHSCLQGRGGHEGDMVHSHLQGRGGQATGATWCIHTSHHITAPHPIHWPHYSPPPYTLATLQPPTPYTGHIHKRVATP